MQKRVLVFAIFAAAMLFSMIREWSAPESCPRLPMASRSPHPGMVPVRR